MKNRRKVRGSKDVGNTCVLCFAWIKSATTIKAPNVGYSTDRKIDLTLWDLQFLPFGDSVGTCDGTWDSVVFMFCYFETTCKGWKECKNMGKRLFKVLDFVGRVYYLGMVIKKPLLVGSKWEELRSHGIKSILQSVESPTFGAFIVVVERLKKHFYLR